MSGRVLALGVAHRELMVDGVPVEATGTVARELASRLYRRGVGAVTIQRGITLEGLRTMLGWIAAEREANDSDTPPQVAGFAIGRLAYDRLVLSDEESVKTEIDALWRALAEAAFDGDRSWHTQRQRLEDSTPEQVADAITRHLATDGYAERVGFVLGTLASHVGKAAPAVREEIGDRLQRLMRRIGKQSIATVVKAVGRGREQRRFVASVVDVLPVKAVIEWLEMAASATDQELSHHLLRILSKLSVHAGTRRTRLDTLADFRDAARTLVDGWDLGDPNPEEHAALLDHIAMIGAAELQLITGADGTMSEAGLIDSVGEATRLVQMACELGTAGADAMASVETLVAAGQTRRVLEWLAMSSGSTAAAQLRSQLLSPTAIISSLSCEPFDAEAARLLLADVDTAKAPILLDALQVAPSRVARRMIYDRLTAEGPSLFPELRRRLNGSAPWYFIRNLLALLRDIGVRLGGADSGLWISDVAAYQIHSREQVRLEALRLLVKDARFRDTALCCALDDTSSRVVSAAVDAALLMVGNVSDDVGVDTPDSEASMMTRDASANGVSKSGQVLLSRELAIRLMRVVDEQAGEETTRARAVRALSAAYGPTVRGWLMGLVTQRTRVLRRLRLAKPSATVYAALDILNSQYSAHPDVQRVLARVSEQWGDRRVPMRRPIPQTPGSNSWE